MRRFIAIAIVLGCFAGAAPQAQAIWYPGKLIVKTVQKARANAKARRSHRRASRGHAQASAGASVGSSCPGGMCPR